MLVSGSHVPVAMLPQRWVLAGQESVHIGLAAVPVHVLPVAQALHDVVPQVAFARFDTQAVPHRWVPAVLHV
jgi:hypothetical protein